MRERLSELEESLSEEQTQRSKLELENEALRKGGQGIRSTATSAVTLGAVPGGDSVNSSSVLPTSSSVPVTKIPEKKITWSSETPTSSVASGKRPETRARAPSKALMRAMGEAQK